MPDFGRPPSLKASPNPKPEDGAADGMSLPSVSSSSSYSARTYLFTEYLPSSVPC